MKSTTTKVTFEDLPTTYEGLCALHLPRRIHDKVGLDNAVEMLDVLAVPFTNGNLNPDQEDYIVLLSDLVEAYEKATLPPDPKLGGLSLLKFLLEEHDMTGDDLGRVLGVNRSVAYRILKGERNLTTAHIKALAAHFTVDAGLFL